MILDSYLQYIQKEETLQEFITVPMIAILVKVYTRHLSKAAKACIGHTRVSKTICILEYRLKAAQNIQTDLKKIIGKCRSSKNPQKCVLKVNNRINYFKRKEQKIRQQLSKAYQKV
jgi:hypothetical protein